jgi:hypothetical protein
MFVLAALTFMASCGGDVKPVEDKQAPAQPGKEPVEPPSDPCVALWADWDEADDKQGGEVIGKLADAGCVAAANEDQRLSVGLFLASNPDAVPTRPEIAALAEQPQPEAATSEYDCGLQCSGATHIQRFRCETSCGQCTPACQHNAVECRANSGSYFLKCGVTPCPTGYHAESYGAIGPDCDSCGAGSCNTNQTRCVKHDPIRAFDVCAMSCPSGFKQIGSSYDSKCNSNCTASTEPNKVRCKRPVLQAIQQ